MESRFAGRVLQAAIDLLFPCACVGCGAIGELFCPRCAQAVEPVPANLCHSCGRIQSRAVAQCASCRGDPNPPLVAIRAAALHTTPLREAIFALKYRGRPEIAPSLGRYLVATLSGPTWLGLPATFDAIVPVPLHTARMAERGYNQSELLARHLETVTGWTLRPEWICRTRSTRQQVGLTPQERKANVNGAFHAEAEVAGQTILLVDDVYTTGATLRACASAAQAAGASAIYALTLAIPRPEQ